MFAHFLLTLAPHAPLALFLAQSEERSNVPVYVVVIIVLVLLLILLAAWTSSSGIKESEEESEPEARHDIPEKTASGSAPEPAPAPEPEPKPAPEPEPAPAPEPEPKPEPEPAKPDDLKKVEGIGPKIQSVLAEAGITTFAQLAAASVADLERIVRVEAGIRVAYPDTWPEQAKLAADGNWTALERFQDELKGGRRT